MYARALQGNASSQNAKIFEQAAPILSEFGWRIASNALSSSSSSSSLDELVEGAVKKAYPAIFNVSERFVFPFLNVSCIKNGISFYLFFLSFFCPTEQKISIVNCIVLLLNTSNQLKKKR